MKLTFCLLEPSSCREKKDYEVQTLEGAKDRETDDLSVLERDNIELQEKLAKIKAHYARVVEFAKKNNIELKPRNVPLNMNNGGGPGGS